MSARPRKRPRKIGRAVSAAGLITAAILVGSIAAGGSYALWNVTGSIANAATIKSGSASLSVTALSGSPTVLYPGVTSYQTATVSNTTPAATTGSKAISLALTIESLSTSTSTGFSAGLSFTVGIVTSTANCLSGTFVATPWTGGFATVLGSTKPSLGVTLAPSGASASAVLCLAITLPATAAATTQVAATPTFTLVVGGTVVS